MFQNQTQKLCLQYNQWLPSTNPFLIVKNISFPGECFTLTLIQLIMTSK